MTMIQIAEIYPDFLYTFISQYGVNEWDDAYDKLTDIEFLENFFSDNENDLLYGYYQGRVSNVTDAALLTIRLARDFFENILLCCEQGGSLDCLFKNLDNRSSYPALLLSSKTKNMDKCDWLRVYGIRIDNSLYTITGGTIKLTHFMEDREHTQEEYIKLGRYKMFLSGESIFDSDSLLEFIESN